MGSQYSNRHFLQRSSARDENVIPMINVIFLLLLYFMVVGKLQSDYDISPPLSTRHVDQPSQMPSLSVNREGVMWFENREVDLAGLVTELSVLDGQDRLKIHADAQVAAQTISQIMRVSAATGIFKFVLVVGQRPDEE